MIQTGEKDEGFKKEREKNDWKDDISEQFSHWLNQKIKHEKLNMADPEYREWQKQFLEKLRELKEDLELTV